MNAFEFNCAVTHGVVSKIGASFPPIDNQYLLPSLPKKMEYPLVSPFETNPDGFNPITSESVPVNRKNIELEIQVTCDFYNGTWGPVTMTS